MDLNKEVMRKAYEPFGRLAIYHFAQYTLLMFLMILFSLTLIDIVDAKGSYPWHIAIIAYLILCAKAFGILALSLIEQKNRGVERALVKIEWIETDGLLGDYKNANQEIKYCYPQAVDAKRKKLICITEKGERIRLRMIGSKRKMKMIREMFLLDPNEKSVYITFGKLTRIIFTFESTETKNSVNYESVKRLNRLF